MLHQATHQQAQAKLQAAIRAVPKAAAIRAAAPRAAAVPRAAAAVQAIQLLRLRPPPAKPNKVLKLKKIILKRTVRMSRPFLLLKSLIIHLPCCKINSGDS